MATEKKDKLATSPAGGLTPAAQERLAKFNDREFWLKDKVDEDTGEITRVPRYRYLEGKPRGIRVDLKAGKFNIEGITPLGNTLTIQPVAWHFFSGDILGMGKKDWAELFFFDKNDVLCAILLHGYSVENLMALQSELYYADNELDTVLLTITPGKKEGLDKDEKKTTYYIAEFTQEPAPDVEKTK
ncbi:MAG: hypothetical protein JWP57_4255, partial [Spirosoma sp.]|nr:hypothetical protein [Spirosoma sp.]